MKLYFNESVNKVVVIVCTHCYWSYLKTIVILFRSVSVHLMQVFIYPKLSVMHSPMAARMSWMTYLKLWPTKEVWKWRSMLKIVKCLHLSPLSIVQCATWISQLARVWILILGNFMKPVKYFHVSLVSSVQYAHSISQLAGIWLVIPRDFMKLVSDRYYG